MHLATEISVADISVAKSVANFQIEEGGKGIVNSVATAVANSRSVANFGRYLATAFSVAKAVAKQRISGSEREHSNQPTLRSTPLETVFYVGLDSEIPHHSTHLHL